jgi:hypothetical protein
MRTVAVAPARPTARWSEVTQVGCTAFAAEETVARRPSSRRSARTTARDARPAIASRLSGGEKAMLIDFLRSV